MEMLFVICAILGSTLLVAQFILGLIGFGHEGFDHDLGGNLGHDFGSHDGPGHDLTQGDSSDGHSAGGTAHDQATEPPHSHGSTEFFKVLSFRTVVAALVFFGLAGLAAEGAQLDAPQPLLIALASGAAAMYAVFYLMQSLGRLRSDGTERIAGAVGREGTVYLGIPGAHAGAGKIQLTLQNRLIEYDAVTAGGTLPTGTRAVVVDVIHPGTVEVARAETRDQGLEVRG